jgi:uncharacterized protein YbjQ (UPF0145 family)
MFICPKCGHTNPNNVMNCMKCKINLQFAFDNIERLKAEWEGKENLEKDQIEFEIKLKNIICTTAPSLEGYRIKETLDVITSECVFGMNLFRDFFAALTDIFGGRSRASQKVLRDARQVCLRELRKEALEVGGDAVIGIKLDYSEFSGGGKSMLFLVASGTAVKIEPISSPHK